MEQTSFIFILIIYFNLWRKDLLDSGSKYEKTQMRIYKIFLLNINFI